MRRVRNAFCGLFLGGVLGVASLTGFIMLTSPQYYQQSGNPPLVPGLFLGGPPGAFLGLVIGGMLPEKRRK